MQCKTLIVLIAVATMALSSAAMARGGGASAGASAMASGSHSGHGGHFNHFNHRIRNKQVLFGGWGWGWDWPYSDGGYNNTTVVVAPQAAPRFPAADVTGALAAAPCHWDQQTFNVPSSGGANRPVQVVSCR